MSRIGKQPIAIPAGVTITVDDNSVVSVHGPKGNLSQKLLTGITIKTESDTLVVLRANDEQEQRAKHGLYRTLINNMVLGVTKGFEKKLEVNGVGFRVALAGTNIKMNLGFSHEVVYALPQGIQASVDQNVITIGGIDKQLVGQTAADIRSLKKPEPYKGKGIMYVGERVLRKSGKSGKD